MEMAMEMDTFWFGCDQIRFVVMTITITIWRRDGAPPPTEPNRHPHATPTRTRRRAGWGE